MNRQIEPSAVPQTARMFGAVGDGVADDTAALQRALDATFARDRKSQVLNLEGLSYKVTATLRVDLLPAGTGDIGHQLHIFGAGARIISAISHGRNIIEVSCSVTARFLVIEGMDIQGSGQDGDGMSILCDWPDRFLYNICLRDIVVQGCGRDGCRVIGNVFESQILNCYFRDNRGNGLTLGHGRTGATLSALHIFGSVFGGNGGFGAELANLCYDASFHGCYFLLNGSFGLHAANGCTLLSNCGFENNHEKAADFAKGDAGIYLQCFATLIGCTSYSIFKQTHLIRAYATSFINLIGCSGEGDGAAKAASLAVFSGSPDGRVSTIGCKGHIRYEPPMEGTEIGGQDSGAKFGAQWNGTNLLRLGDYHLWVDKGGRLRGKSGRPTSDQDGSRLGD